MRRVGEGLGGVRAYQRTKLGKHGRFSLLRAYQERTKNVPTNQNEGSAVLFVIGLHFEEIEGLLLDEGCAGWLRSGPV